MTEKLLDGDCFVVDIETDSLNPKKLWCVVAQRVDPTTGEALGEPLEIIRPDKHGWPENLKIGTWIGHNFIGFDAPALEALVPGLKVPRRNILDTFVISRWLNFKRAGGHSLEAWAHKFPEIEGGKVTIDKFDDENLIEDYVERCKVDVEINRRVFQFLLKYISNPKFHSSIRVELDIEIINRQMKKDGFHFDKGRAKRLLVEVEDKLAFLNEEIEAAFPPKFVLKKEIHPKATKIGELNKTDFRWEDEGNLHQYSPGCPFSLIEVVHFNPASPKQRVDALNKAGWRPINRTDGYNKAVLQERLTPELHEYGWKCDETNLSTLPPDAPDGARALAQWLVLEGKRRELTQWLEACSDDSRIHGTVWGIGTWTHRMAHTDPNTGNIASASRTERDREPTPVEKIKIEYNGQLRSLWTATPGKELVGCDADGIQLRVLAHYVADVDPEYAKAIEEGRKEDETDIHNLNRRKLGEVCKSRDDAKTFIYAWILGASPRKIAAILGCTSKQAKEAMKMFLEATPGLRYVKEELVPRDAARGYFIGLDGRPVVCNSEHLMLAGYLQNGEAVVMKHANVLWRTEAKRESIWFRQVNTVHDEWQTEADIGMGESLGATQARSIQRTGELLGVKCRLEGSYRVGSNWLDTH